MQVLMDHMNSIMHFAMENEVKVKLAFLDVPITYTNDEFKSLYIIS